MTNKHFLLASALAATFSMQAISYQLVPERSDDLNAVINKATARMNFVTRPIARSRLKSTNAPYKYLSIEETPDTISISYEGRAPVRAPADGTPVPWLREDGEKFEVWMKRADGVLRHNFKAEDGERLNEFSWNAAGDTLTLNVTLTSPRLPEPVRYRLVYVSLTSPDPSERIRGASNNSVEAPHRFCPQLCVPPCFTATTVPPLS